MVTPALRKVFEHEGVGLIPLESGAEYLVREMGTAPGGPVEIVVLGPGSRVGDSDEPAGGGGSADRDEVEVTGGAERGWREAAVDPEMVLAFERVVDVETHPVLRAHVMKGRAVLPAALMVEWLAHGAMHEHPGMVFCGVDDLQVTKGVTLSVEEKVKLAVYTGAAVGVGGGDGDKVAVPVEMRSAAGLHARARVVLGSRLPDSGPSHETAVGDQVYTSSRGNEKVYGDGRLFHGEALAGVEAGIRVVSRRNHGEERGGAGGGELDAASAAECVDRGAAGDRWSVSIDDFVEFCGARGG